MGLLLGHFGGHGGTLGLLSGARGSGDVGGLRGRFLELSDYTRKRKIIVLSIREKHKAANGEVSGRSTCALYA